MCASYYTASLKFREQVAAKNREATAEPQVKHLSAMLHQRQSICRLAAHLSNGTLSGTQQSCPASVHAAAAMAALPNRMQQALHILLGDGSEHHTQSRTFTSASASYPLQQHHKCRCALLTQRAHKAWASLPLNSWHASSAAFYGSSTQPSVCRCAPTSVALEAVAQPGPRRNSRGICPVCQRASRIQASYSRVGQTLRHSSSDRDGGPAGYSAMQHHVSRHPQDSRVAKEPELEGDLRTQGDQRAQQQCFIRAARRSPAEWDEFRQRHAPRLDTYRGQDASGPAPFPPGRQQTGMTQRPEWWQPPPGRQGPSFAGHVPRPPMQPMYREPMLPPPPAPEPEAALFPDETEIRLVREDKSHEVMTYRKAVREAQRAGMDLIGVALSAEPPVLRLGNADKAAAEARQRDKELRRKEVETRRKHTVKEVRIGPMVAEHDLEVKMKQARGFVEKNYRVKLFVPYRMPQKQEAFAMLSRLRELGREFAVVTNPAANERLARNTYAIFLSPKQAA
ncbi:probable translation initiation factor IF-3 at C-terminar half [Coccomyxa sp. Obi]|nr:probable translation initiation factor IF-3 at C-terminar half [Coccomyxa sp. Obi]